MIRGAIRVVAELILAEQAGPDRRAALRSWHIRQYTGFLAGFDIFNLEITFVGRDTRSAVLLHHCAKVNAIVRQRRGEDSGFEPAYHPPSQSQSLFAGCYTHFRPPGTEGILQCKMR